MTEEPPLSLSALADAHSHHNPARGRWLLALGLLAGTAALFLAEALYAAMDRSAHFAIAPALFEWDSVARADVAALRGNRLTPARAGRAGDQVRVEQLRASGLSMRPFTHVVAFLAQIPTGPQAAQPAAPAQPALPPEILYGQSRPPAASEVSAYASVGSPAQTAPAPEQAAPAPEPPPLGSPINVTDVPESAPGRQIVERVVVAKPGDALATILRALGASQDQAAQIASLYPVQGAVFAGGEKISVLEDRAGGGGALGQPLQVRVERQGAPVWAVALADDGRYDPQEERPALASPPPTVAPAADEDLSQSADESVQDSFYGLVAARGVDRALVDQMVRLCGHDFDLQAPVAASDRVEFLYTKGDPDQQELRYVKLTAQGKTQEYYRFTAPDDGSVDYYDREGRSVTKFLLRKPVPNGRLGDGFGWRIHPILKDWRFHEGVDYDAPMGSPIEAAGAGVVEIIGEESGYGSYIRIKHDLGYETTYGHVSGFARGLKVGSRVRQGEVIAYVGSTGLSTGPHLYYEVRINGHNVNPLKIRLADGRILTGAVLADFENRRALTDELINASTIERTASAGAASTR